MFNSAVQHNSNLYLVVKRYKTVKPHKIKLQSNFMN